ncbi:MAG: hypothetical protein GXY86_08730 [Firmicutes bacterium]|nr:hypothetical protein [Bacillota bacterium]
MNKVILLSLLLLTTTQGCFAEKSSFIIDIGEKPRQLGFEVINGYKDGPISLSEFDRKIYILDVVNKKINIYKYSGEYINSIHLPKTENLYQDIAINSQGQVLLLCENGIYILDKENLKKQYSLPDNVSVPYYFSINNRGNVIFNGLRKPGGKTGIVCGEYKDRKFKELNGYIIVSSYKGLVGLWGPDNMVTIYDQGKISETIDTFLDTVIPFGLNDNKELYCTERIASGYRFYKINKEGIINIKEMEFSSSLLGDESIILRSFRLTKNEEIICLDVNKDRCKVLIFRL